MEAPRLSYFAMIFVLLLAIISFTFVVFDLRGVAFAFELALLLAFMFLLAFAVFGITVFGFRYYRRGNWGIIGAVLVVMIFDTLIIALFRGVFSASYAFTILFAIIGLIIVLYSYMTAPGEKKYVEKQYDKSRYYYASVDRVEAKQESKGETREELKQEVRNELKEDLTAEQKKAALMKKNYALGKFIASRKANTFHVPICVWADNINEENQVWFDSRADAIAKGYSEHECDIVTGTTTAK